MNATTTVAAVLVVLLAAGGAAAAGTGGVPAVAADQEAQTNGPTNVDASATYDDGTVTVTVLGDGGPVENVSVEVDDRRGTTDANGTVALETNASDELTVELEKGAFEGELSYVVQNGSLTLVEESYEYEVADESEAGESSEVEREDGDEDAETEDEDAESEDDDETESEDDDAETDDDEMESEDDETETEDTDDAETEDDETETEDDETESEDDEG